MKYGCLLIAMMFVTRVSAQMNLGAQITKNNYFEIPFTGTVSEIKTKVTLTNNGEYDFMLDTGAPAFISSEVQKKYKFPILYKSKTEDAGGKLVTTLIVKIDTIRFGPFIFTGIPAIVIDMDNSPLGCLHLAGNLGSNALRFLHVRFDRQGQKISFADNEQLFSTHLSPTYHMDVTHQSDVLIPVKLDDDIADTIQYDSGDGQLYNISATTMERYKAAHPANITHSGFGTVSMGIGGIGSSFPQYIATPDEIDLAGHKLMSGRVTIAGNNRSRMGRELLNYGILQLNYPDSTYAFEPYNSPHLTTRADYGFIPIMDGDRMTAGCVWENSTAEQQGLRSGDHILGINDLDFSKMDECAITTLTREIMLMNKDIKVTFRHKKQTPQTITLPYKAL